jgi:uncharacterized membrane protein
VQVKTGTPSPSIVITNENRRRIDQPSIGILSQKSLKICEIQVCTKNFSLANLMIMMLQHHNGDYHDYQITMVIVGCIIVSGFYSTATVVQPNRTCWIETSNAQGG